MTILKDIQVTSKFLLLLFLLKSSVSGIAFQQKKCNFCKFFFRKISKINCSGSIDRCPCFPLFFC